MIIVGKDSLGIFVERSNNSTLVSRSVPLPACDLRLSGSTWSAVVAGDHLTLKLVTELNDQEEVRQRELNQLRLRRAEVSALERDIAKIVSNHTIDANTAAVEIELNLAARNNHLQEIVQMERAPHKARYVETTTVLQVDPLVWYAWGEKTFMWVPFFQPTPAQEATAVLERFEALDLDV